MKKGFITAAVLLLCGLFLCSCTASGSAKTTADTDQILSETAKYLMKENPNPGLSSVGGDWIIKGLTLSGTEVPQEYYDIYYDNIRSAVKKQKGILSEDHYTEYMRPIIALTAIGKDVTDVEGYDLTPYLDDADKVTAQGVNASSWALTAAKACGVKLQNEELYLNDILTELSDERMKKEKAYPDYVGIGLDALSFYMENEEVKEYVQTALEELSALQNEDGAYFSSESTVEVLIALTQLGIDYRTDERFIKNGKNLGDALMTFYAGNGQFRHLADDKESNEFSTEKAFLALGAIRVFENGQKCYEEARK